MVYLYIPVFSELKEKTKNSELLRKETKQQRKTCEQNQEQNMYCSPWRQQLLLP